jgi:uncharacterized membrane protein
MGGADIIPGVSGGTVALILGIYNRLVHAISRFDFTLLNHLSKREWAKAAEYVDLRFLITLGTGIATGILGLASMMHFLLEDQEHISIHSLNAPEKIVQLNVGTAHGGLSVGTVCTVFRQNRETKQFEKITTLQIDSFEEPEGEGASTVRPAIAKPVNGDSIADIKPTDVITHDSTRRPLTMAAFFGLILASGILVARMIHKWDLQRVGMAILGCVASYVLVGLFPVAPLAGNGYLFLCGMLAICAMILPGISGAFILLVLGVYGDVTGLLRAILHRQATPETILSIFIFAVGCGIGLISFSKILNRLLNRYEQTTMAVLCGVMLGSLRKIWPFKHDLTPDAIEFREKVYENIMPESFDGKTWLMFGIMLVAAGSVFLLDRLTSGIEDHPLLDDDEAASSDSSAGTAQA